MPLREVVSAATGQLLQVSPSPALHRFHGFRRHRTTTDKVQHQELSTSISIIVIYCYPLQGSSSPPLALDACCRHRGSLLLFALSLQPGLNV